MAHRGPGGSAEAGGSGAPAREEDHVVLLDAHGRPVGTAAKSGVHSTDTPLHLAFSCYLLDDRGRVLLTRRSLAKATWPGVWTNTCCGHPRPDEPPEAAVARRLREELGVRARGLSLILPDFAYRAVDASGTVEHELCPVWLGHLEPGPLTPDPAEVMASSWVEWADLVELARRAPDLLSPWAVLQVQAIADLLDDLLPVPAPAPGLPGADVRDRSSSVVGMGPIAGPGPDR